MKKQGLIGLILMAVCCAAMAADDFSVTAGTNSTVVLASRGLAVGRVPSWGKSTAYAAGETFMTAAQQFYLVRTAGTSGTAAPVEKSAAVTNGTLVAEYIPRGPRIGFVIVNAGTNVVDLAVGSGTGGVRLWPRGSWSEAGGGCPQTEVRAATEAGESLLTGCWW